MNDVAAVVVRWRGGDEVARCLAALLAHGGARLGEVVLVDSGSGDGGGEALAARFPDVRLLALTENRGFAAAASAGVAASRGALVLLLNPDTELTAGALNTLAGFLDTHNDAAGAVPLLEGLDGASQHRWQLRRLPSPFRLALGLPGAPAFSRPPTRPTPVEQPAAAAWLVRRQAWDALGGFDAAFAPAWWEDVDFCARLAARGGGFWVVPAARVRHAGGSSVASLSDADFLAAYYRNLLRYAERYHPRWSGAIRRGMELTTRVRAALRPGRRAAYLEARRRISRGQPPG